MTNLTELYQKGKLPKGYYYLKKPDGEVMIITPSLRFMVDGYSILAEVPSYEEWQAKLEENTKFKELLKECRSPINYALCLNLSEEEKIEFKNLLAKIKQVLGEE